MKTALIGILFVLLLLPAKAQIFQVIAQGTVTSAGNLVGVTAGTPFTETFTIVPSPPAIEYPDYALYLNSASSLVLNLGSYTFTENGLNVGIGSDSGGEYGYIFSYTPADSIVLFSTTVPAVAPNVSLSSIQAFPVSDFNFENNFEFSPPSAVVYGSVSSYSVEPIPEPSVCYFLVMGLLAISLGFGRNKLAAAASAKE